MLPCGGRLLRCCCCCCCWLWLGDRRPAVAGRSCTSCCLRLRRRLWQLRRLLPPLAWRRIPAAAYRGSRSWLLPGCCGRLGRLGGRGGGARLALVNEVRVGPCHAHSWLQLLPLWPLSRQVEPQVGQAARLGPLLTDALEPAPAGVGSQSTVGRGRAGGVPSWQLWAVVVTQLHWCSSIESCRGTSFGQQTRDMAGCPSTKPLLPSLLPWQHSQTGIPGVAAAAVLLNRLVALPALAYPGSGPRDKAGRWALCPAHCICRPRPIRAGAARPRSACTAWPRRR
jgi:hypothetical protein